MPGAQGTARSTRTGKPRNRAASHLTSSSQQLSTPPHTSSSSHSRSYSHELTHRSTKTGMPRNSAASHLTSISANFSWSLADRALKKSRPRKLNSTLQYSKGVGCGDAGEVVCGRGTSKVQQGRQQHGQQGSQAPAAAGQPAVPAPDPCRSQRERHNACQLPAGTVTCLRLCPVRQRQLSKGGDIGEAASRHFAAAGNAGGGTS